MTRISLSKITRDRTATWIMLIRLTMYMFSYPNCAHSLPLYEVSLPLIRNRSYCHPSQTPNWSNGFHHLACVLLSPVPRPTFQYQIPLSEASTLSAAHIRIKTGALRHSDRFWHLAAMPLYILMTRCWLHPLSGFSALSLSGLFVQWTHGSRREKRLRVSSDR